MAEEKIIEARIFTKVDSLENWNNNPLLLGPGELALVTNGQGVPMNMKWGDKTTRKRFSELPFAIAYDQGQFVAVTSTTLPASTTGKVRYSLVGEGTYTRSGMTSVVVPTGKMGIIVDDGTTWSLGSSVALPKGDNGINGKTFEPFNATKPGGYLTGSQTIFKGRLWESISDAAIGESPETHPAKWKLDLGKDSIEKNSSEIVTETAVVSYTKPVFDMLKYSVNKINYQNFKGVIYVYNSGTNAITKTTSTGRVWVSVDVKPLTKYYFAGYRSTIVDTEDLVIFSNGSETLGLGSVLKGGFTGFFTTPANCVRVFLAIEVLSGSGNNPTAVIQKDTAILAELGDSTAPEVQVPFVPYGYGLDGTKITGDIPQVVVVADKVNDITMMSPQLFNNLTMESGGYSSNGAPQASNNQIRTPILPLEKGKTHITFSGWGFVSAITTRVFFYSDTGAFLSSVLAGSSSSGAPLTAPIPTGAGKWSARVANETNIGLDPTNSPYKNTFMVNYGEEALPFDFYSTDYFVDGSKIKNQGSETGTTVNPECLYQFIPNGSITTGRNRMRVFTKYKGSETKYIGFDIDNVYDMQETKYQNLYKITGAFIYDYNPLSNAFSPTSIQIIFEGESECVYRINDSYDFTGGGHGNEIYSRIEFYADGILIDTGAITANQVYKCTEFEYRQVSTTHEVPNAAGVVNPAHPVEAIHDKKTKFGSSYYETFNRLTWQKTTNVLLWYHGICCMHKNNATMVENEYFQQQEMTGDNSPSDLLRTGARDYFGYNLITDLSARITSKLLKPLSRDEFCDMFIWDRVNDTKYYRRFVPVQSPISGEIWESIMRVEFSKERV